MGKLINKNTFLSSIPLPLKKQSQFGLPMYDCKIIKVGVNIFPDDELEQILSNAFVKEQVKSGNFVVKETSVKIVVQKDSKKSDVDKAVAEITEMTSREAKTTILGNSKKSGSLGLMDIEILKKLKDLDQRRGVQEAVDKQIELLYSREEE